MWINPIYYISSRSLPGCGISFDGEGTGATTSCEYLLIFAVSGTSCRLGSDVFLVVLLFC